MVNTDYMFVMSFIGGLYLMLDLMHWTGRHL
jgi:hypothetical protein